jgi:hypothetical protein
MALRPWAERCAEMSGPPQKMAQQMPDCTIGGNSPTMVYGLLEDTPTHTPLDRANGAVRSMAGFASSTGQDENPYAWINGASLAAPMEPTNG